MILRLTIIMLHYVRINVHILVIHFLMTLYNSKCELAVLLPPQLPPRLEENMAQLISAEVGTSTNTSANRNFRN